MEDGPKRAIKNTEHRVQPVHTPRQSSFADSVDWDDLRMFLEVVRLQSLRAAAQAERVSVNTIRARIHKLEKAYGAPLLRRSRFGSTATDAGEEVMQLAEEMRAAALRRKHSAEGNVLVSPGEVRLSCSEGLGLLWLTPRMPALSSELGSLTANLRLDYDLARDRTQQVDVGLTFARPTDPDLVMARLATLHYMMFASASYIRDHGKPASLDEVKHHRIVEQVTPGVNSWMIDFLLGSERPEGLVSIRTNSSLSQLWAVATGAGIAAMPTYVRASTRSVIPIDPPLNLRFDLYYVIHAGARGSPAIETTLAWLRACFDPALYPWFRSEFVHPDDFPKPDKSARVVSLFDSLEDSILARERC